MFLFDRFPNTSRQINVLYLKGKISHAGKQKDITFCELFFGRNEMFSRQSLAFFILLSFYRPRSSLSHSKRYLPMKPSSEI